MAVTGADIDDVARAVGMDNRIGSRFLKAGVGFGGSCFQKDILNLVYLCDHYGLTEVAQYWRHVVDINRYQQDRFVANLISRMFNTVAGKRIAVFGFAFKADTGDTRESPAIRICKLLAEEKAELAITDPRALDNAKKDLSGVPGSFKFEPDPCKAVKGAHAVVILTAWQSFKELDYRKVYDLMEKPAFLFDGRGLLDLAIMREIGFEVFAIGKADSHQQLAPASVVARASAPVTGKKH